MPNPAGYFPNGFGVEGALAALPDEPTPGETPLLASRRRCKMPSVSKGGWKKVSSKNMFEAIAEIEDEDQDVPENVWTNSPVIRSACEEVESKVQSIPTTCPTWTRLPKRKPLKHLCSNAGCIEGLCESKHIGSAANGHVSQTGAALHGAAGHVSQPEAALPGVAAKEFNVSTNESTTTPATKVNTVSFLKMLGEARKAGQALMSARGPEFSGKWERLRTTMDSGATVTVIPPTAGKWYDLQESPASRAGVEYEVANGDKIPNLGQKLLPVVTNEGGLRGMLAQVADVSGALTSARALNATGHAVVIDGDESFVLNKETGEVNLIEDDGVAFNFDL